MPLPLLNRLTDYIDPPVFLSKENHLVPLFNEISQHKVSDIFISAGQPISVSVNKRLNAVTKRPIGQSEAIWFLNEIAGNQALTFVNTRRPINKPFSLFDGGKENKNERGYRKQVSFRVNASAIMVQGEPAFQIVLRSIPSEPPHFSEIGMDPKMVDRCCPNQGLVITSGVTGDGKSTSQAATIRYILQNDTAIKGNIITIEEPIEFTYDSILSDHSIVMQSQIPENYANFQDAIVESLRRKPAAILVGELREKGTMDAALEGALTGHPVFGTLHCGSISDVIPRLLSRFPDNKEQVLYDIISTATIFINQRLVPYNKSLNSGYFAVREYIYFSEEIKRKILELADVNKITNYILELMDNAPIDDPSSVVSPNYKRQAKHLLQTGQIDNEGYSKLFKDII